MEPEWNEMGDPDTPMSSTFVTMEEEEENESDMVEVLVAQGDPDAIQVQSFEQDLADMFQEVPELHNALISYQEARSKLTEKKKYRGFWPSKGKKGFGKSFGQRKGGSKGGGKADLLARISRTHCKNCGERGHWNAECPRNPDRNTKDTVNLASQVLESDPRLVGEESSEAHVIIEDWSGK